jgi:hypothetical protein
MTKIWVYGDSFSSVDFNRHVGSSWVDLLTIKYVVKNQSHTGVGPITLINKLIEDVQVMSNKTCNDILIFIIPCAARQSFSFTTKPLEEHLYYHHLEDYKKTPYGNFLKEFYYYYMTDHKADQLFIQHLLSVMQLSSYFKKAIIMHTDEFGNGIRNFFASSLLNLNKIHTGENVWDSSDGFDFRRNHLSEPNHHIMYKQIVNFIENDTPIDPDMFLQNLK